MVDREDARTCAEPGCVALARLGSAFCSIHDAITRRRCRGVGLKCYACGHPIRIGARMLVRAEGVFHVRPACLNAPPSTFAIQIHEPAPVDEVRA